jgi:hypothetical protein
MPVRRLYPRTIPPQENVRMKTHPTLGVLLGLACAHLAYGSEVVSIQYFFPIEFQTRARIQTWSNFHDSYSFTIEHTPIHEALKRTFGRMAAMEGRVSDLPSLDRITIEDGLVILHSKRDHPEGYPVRDVMLQCIKLTIGENLWIARQPRYHIPNIHGFVLRYRSGATLPKKGYYAVVETIKGDVESGPQP